MDKAAFYSQMPDGTRIYYEKSGTGAPLFLLHGNGDSGGYFSYQVPLFEQYFTVYVIDSRAHGKSNNAQPYLDFPLMAEDLVELMAQEGLAQVTLLGFSDGANLAMVFSILHPEKVRSLILNSGNTYVSGIKWWSNLWTRLQYGWYMLLSLFFPKYKQSVQRIQLMIRDIGVSESQLRQMTFPVLIIVGRKDFVTVRHSKYLARTIPHASFVQMTGETHFYAKQNPESFNQQVLQFLKKSVEVRT